MLIRTVYNLTSVDAGFDRSRLVTFSMTLAEPYDPDTRAPAYQRLLDKLQVAPGVQGPPSCRVCRRIDLQKQPYPYREPHRL